jgi:hypothetical protein
MPQPLGLPRACIAVSKITLFGIQLSITKTENAEQRVSQIGHSRRSRMLMMSGAPQKRAKPQRSHRITTIRDEA